MLETCTMEQRSSHRRRVLKAGVIAFEGWTIDCTLRNISASGAGLELGGPVATPATFRLLVEADNLIRVCRVAWRRGQRLGVQFA